MPWKECNRMDERLRFVARLLDGEKMAVVCRELINGRCINREGLFLLPRMARFVSPLNVTTGEPDYVPCAF